MMQVLVLVRLRHVARRQRTHPERLGSVSSLIPLALREDMMGFAGAQEAYLNILEELQVYRVSYYELLCESRFIQVWMCVWM